MKHETKHKVFQVTQDFLDGKLNTDNYYDFLIDMSLAFEDLPLQDQTVEVCSAIHVPLLVLFEQEHGDWTPEEVKQQIRLRLSPTDPLTLN